jgi:PAS domain S-box-containing protein
MKDAGSRAALRIVVLYAVFIALWDVLSDAWSTATVTDLPRLTWLLVAKDWVLGFVTAALLYWILRREFRAQEQAHAQRRASEQAHRESEARYQALYENSMDGILLTDPGGDILSANPAACRIFGRTEEELCQIGRQGVVDVSDPRLMVALKERERSGGFVSELTLLRKDGKFPAEVSSSLFRDKEGNLRTSMIVRDISEQVRAYQFLEQRVEERTRELSTLLEISRNVASTLELQPLLDLILDQLKVMVDYTSASLFTLQGNALVLAAYRGPRLAEEGEPIHLPLLDPLFKEMALDRLEPVFIPDMLTDEPSAQSFRRIMQERLSGLVDGIQTAMWIPLIVKRNVIGGLGVAHSEAGCFTERHATLALTLANQAAIAIENARLYEQAQALATLQERQRLARELHDSVTQSLYSLTLLAEAGRRLAEAGNWGRVQTYLGRLGQTAQQSLKEMRLLVYELRPLALAQEGLVGALQQRLDTVEGRAGVEARLFVEGALQLPAAVEDGLYRIAQEALNNALKHAAATCTTVRIRAEADRVELQVTDNGCGFDPAALNDKGGLGLNNLRERAANLKGVLSISSSPGQGTTVKAQIPTNLSQ